MRFSAASLPHRGFTILESLLMICLMTVLALMTWGIYLKESDPARKGPGVWEKVESSFIPAFREVDNPVLIVPDPPLKAPVGQPQ